MKTRKQSQPSLALKAQVDHGYLTIHARIPTRWLKAVIALGGALLGSVPLAQLLEAATHLPR